MKKTLKKGFTIVELVIVIAVVAILAAVLIPTFVSVTKKANESKDTQLVRNLNTALAVDTEVGKHTTMQSALEAAEKAGYDVAKINTSATDNEILWDSKNDCFVYKKDSGIEYIPNSKTEEATDGDFWKIVADASAVATNEKYNSYVMGAAELGDMTVANGLDVGENTVKGTITFESNETKTVTIRTNGGTLAVNAPEATVKHYGKADKITITAVAPHSYHEYGEVLGNIELANGRVVMETGSKAAAIKVNATVENINAGTAVVSVDTTASAVSVVVPEEVKTAIETKQGDNKITASTDKIVTDSTVIDNMDKFAGGLGTEESPYLIATAEQFDRINELYSSASDIGSFQNLSKYEGNSYYFKQTNDITVSPVNGEKYILRVFTGEYDGDNYILSLEEHINPEERYALIRTVFGEFILKNMSVNFVNGAAYTLISINDFTTNNIQLNAELNNITIISEKTVSLNSGIYGVFWSNYAKNFKSIKFINCINKADVSNGGTTTGVFTGSGWSLSENDYGDTAEKVSVVFENCFNYGNIVGKNQVGVIYGHRQYVTNEIENDCYSFVKLTNVANYGKIKATDKDGCARFAPVYNEYINKDRFAKYTTDYQSLYSVGDNVFDVEDITVSLDLVNNKIATNAEGVSFKVVYVITSMFYDGVPSNTTEYTYNLTREDTVTNSVSKYVARNVLENEEYVFDSYGIYFNVQSDRTELVFERQSGRTFGVNDTTSNVSVFVKAYDAAGMLIGACKVN